MRRIKLILLAGSLLLAMSNAEAQPANPYQLASSLSAGGGIVSGGSYQVGVALGQAGAGEASGGGYTLGGGIFGGGPVTQQQPPKRFVNLPLVRR
jgi:hypothetical protein